MGDWIWVLLTALILFLGVSMISDPGTSIIAQNPLQLSSSVANKSDDQNSTANSALLVSKDTIETTPKNEGSSAVEHSGFDFNFWATILLIPALILLGRILLSARNFVKNHQTPHTGSASS